MACFEQPIHFMNKSVNNSRLGRRANTVKRQKSELKNISIDGM